MYQQKFNGCLLRALERTDKIITISEFSKKELIRILGFKEERIEAIHLGVDHSRYYPMNRQRCRMKFGLKPDEKYLLVVASNLPHKRMDISKKVFDIVKKECPNINTTTAPDVLIASSR